MSKQEQAKQAQGYRLKPQNCGNCKHRAFELRLRDWMKSSNAGNGREIYTIERHGEELNQRCGVGGFAVKKTATCSQWEAM